jgi:hypothetical protein
LWAPMQLPEITIANQSFRKVGFLNASQVEVFLDVSAMGEWLIECLVQYTRTIFRRTECSIRAASR